MGDEVFPMVSWEHAPCSIPILQHLGLRNIVMRSRDLEKQPAQRAAWLTAGVRRPTKYYVRGAGLINIRVQVLKDEGNTLVQL